MALAICSCTIIREEIQHVREKLVCRACEAITQPLAPSHPIARGRAGPKLLAHVLFAKYDPLGRDRCLAEPCQIKELAPAVRPARGWANLRWANLLNGAAVL
ncbi:hypothetical protein AC630_39305 [Bradyrhizobium sp. AS23.2]|nr:hypothetical protein AC630_39305 [Bradyrhizobium sp. AS23.2]